MIILGSLLWTTTNGGVVPPKPRTRGSVGERRERLDAIRRDDEEIMTMAVLLVATMGERHGGE